eukprot:426898_1
MGNYFNRINNKLKEKCRCESNIYKLLFLGSDKSGRQQIFRQLQWLSNGSLSMKDTIILRKHIYSQIIHGMKQVINHFDNHIIIYGFIRQITYSLYNIPTPIIFICAAYYYGISSISGYTISVMRNIHIQHAIHIIRESDQNIIEFDQDLVKAIKCILKSPQDINFVGGPFLSYILDISLSESSKYFLNEIDRIKESKYIPNKIDIGYIQYSESKRACIQHDLSINDFLCRIIQIGTQNSDRDWFSEIDLIVFVVNLSIYAKVESFEYDEFSEHQSLEHFKRICRNSVLYKTNIILLLNKEDIRSNLIVPMSVSILSSCSDFMHEHKVSDNQQIEMYLKNKFESLNENKYRKMFVHIIGKDTDCVQLIYDDVTLIKHKIA